MPVLAAYAVPHPPIILPEVGHGEERKISRTVEAYDEVMRRIAAHHPDVIILSSPHATLYADYFHISPGSGACGSFAQFHAPNLSVHADYDTELVKRIETLAHHWNLPAGTMGEREKALDHGTMIPLLFLKKTGFSCPIIRVSLSGLTTLAHYHLGQCIAEAVDALNRRAVFIASGDLSHKLKADGPYGFSAQGPIFDQKLTQAFASGDFSEMLSISPDLADAAAECGWRSFQIMAGALDQKAVKSELLSYEGPFGVGYGVAAFEVTGEDYHRCFGKRFEQARHQDLKQTQAHEDAYVRLARLSLETYVRTGERAKIPEDISPDLRHLRSGVFVSLKKDGHLRGCIGTVTSTADSLAAEIMRNAISAAAHDPRFEPVREEELPELVYSVDVLGQAESIASSDQLDPKRYGVIVQNGARRGLLLPDLEGVDTPEQQIEIARRKAGIEPDETVRLSRFEVVRHH